MHNKLFLKMDKKGRPYGLLQSLVEAFDYL